MSGCHGDGSSSLPIAWERSGRKGRRPAQGPRFSSRSGPRDLGGPKLSLGSSRPVLTGRPPSETAALPPRPAQPEGGAAQPQRTFCRSFLWLSDSSKGASSSMMSPQRSFPGIPGRRHLPPGAVATTTYGHRERERKRGLGGRKPGPCVTSGPRTSRREPSRPKSPGGDSPSKVAASLSQSET